MDPESNTNGGSQSQTSDEDRCRYIVKFEPINISLVDAVDRKFNKIMVHASAYPYSFLTVLSNECIFIKKLFT